jgi:hypothetical protein
VVEKLSWGQPLDETVADEAPVSELVRLRVDQARHSAPVYGLLAQQRRDLADVENAALAPTLLRRFEVVVRGQRVLTPLHRLVRTTVQDLHQLLFGYKRVLSRLLNRLGFYPRRF